MPHDKRYQPTRCHAHNRAGEQCRKWAIRGKDVCRAHGGATPIKHGGRSKYPEAVGYRARVEKVRADRAKLHDLDESLAHLIAVRDAIADALDAMPSGAPIEAAETILKIVMAHGQAIERSIKLAEVVDHSQIDSLKILTERVVYALNRHVPDDQLRRAIVATITDGLDLDSPAAGR